MPRVKTDTKKDFNTTPSKGGVQKPNKQKAEGAQDKVRTKVAKATGKDVSDLTPVRDLVAELKTPQNQLLDKVFIGNLPFTVKDDIPALKQFFADIGEVENVVWHEKAGKFAGTGIVTFGSQKVAEAAIEQKNGKVFGGRKMRVKKVSPFLQNDAGEPSHSLFLNNLPFNIREDELRTAYKPCGRIEAIDFPKRTGQAYIRFGSLEASEAGLALSATLSFKERPVRAEYAMEERKVKPKSEYFKSEDTDTDTFFIGGLPLDVSDGELKALFPDCEVENIRRTKNKAGKFSGVCFVRFSSKGEAKKAYSIVKDGVTLKGRVLRLDWAPDRPEKVKQETKSVETNETI